MNDLSDESGRDFYRKVDDETDLKLNRMTIAMELWREARARAQDNPWQFLSTPHLEAMLADAEHPEAAQWKELREELQKRK
jgi:hypothetical protein